VINKTGDVQQIEFNQKDNKLYVACLPKQKEDDDNDSMFGSMNEDVVTCSVIEDKSPALFTYDTINGSIENVFDSSYNVHMMSISDDTL